MTSSKLIAPEEGGLKPVSRIDNPGNDEGGERLARVYQPLGPHPGPLGAFFMLVMNRCDDYSTGDSIKGSGNCSSITEDFLGCLLKAFE